VNGCKNNQDQRELEQKLNLHWVDTGQRHVTHEFWQTAASKVGPNNQLLINPKISLFQLTSFSVWTSGNSNF